MPWAVLFVGCTAATLTAQGLVFEVPVFAVAPPRYVPAWEAIPALCGIVGAGLLPPRLWSWERTGRLGAARVRAATLSFVSILLPASIPALAHAFVLPDQARWWDVVWNVVWLSSVSMIATAALGRLVGPLIALTSYVVIVVLQQGYPRIGRVLPLSGTEGNLEPHWVLGLLFASMAMATWGVTLGRGSLTRRMTANDEG